MTTFQYFITRFLHHVEAFSFSADISKCWLHTWRWLFEFFLTESATFGVSLSAHFTQVIWLGVTAGTEVFLALMASNSIVGHVNSCFMTYRIASFVFESFLDFTWHKFHDITTWAAYKIWIQFNNLQFLLLRYFSLLVWSKVLIKFEILNFNLTSCTFYIFILRLSVFSLIFKTINMALMPTISTL